MISFVNYISKDRTIGRKQISGCQGLGIVGMYDYSGAVQGILGVEDSDRRVLYPDCGGSYMNLCMCYYLCNYF